MLDRRRSARILAAGGESLENLGARERQRPENDNLRLKNMMLIIGSVGAIIGFLSGASLDSRAVSPRGTNDAREDAAARATHAAPR